MCVRGRNVLGVRYTAGVQTPVDSYRPRAALVASDEAGASALPFPLPLAGAPSALSGGAYRARNASDAAQPKGNAKRRT